MLFFRKLIQLHTTCSKHKGTKCITIASLYQRLYRDVKTRSDKELKFRMRVKQSQILTMQYVNSRQHKGKWRFSYTAAMACVAVLSCRKLVQWNVIVLYPFCVRATFHVPVKSLNRLVGRVERAIWKMIFLEVIPLTKTQSHKNSFLYNSGTGYNKHKRPKLLRLNPLSQTKKEQNWDYVSICFYVSLHYTSQINLNIPQAPHCLAVISFSPSLEVSTVWILLLMSGPTLLVPPSTLSVRLTSSPASSSCASLTVPHPA